MRRFIAARVSWSVGGHHSKPESRGCSSRPKSSFSSTPSLSSSTTSRSPLEHWRRRRGRRDDKLKRNFAAVSKRLSRLGCGEKELSVQELAHVCLSWAVMNQKARMVAGVRHRGVEQADNVSEEHLQHLVRLAATRNFEGANLMFWDEARVSPASSAHDRCTRFRGALKESHRFDGARQTVCLFRVAPFPLFIIPLRCADRFPFGLAAAARTQLWQALVRS